MSRARTLGAADIHPHRCDCAACEPYRDAHPRRLGAGDRFGMLTTAAAATGLALCWLVDRLIGGPGISVMWGA